MSQVRPEVELLILLARQDLDDVQFTRANELTWPESPVIDWGEFLDLAVQHRVAQLAGSHSRRLLDSGSIRGNATSALLLLQDAYIAGIERSKLIRAELTRVLEACAGSHVAIRKGAHLAFHTYREPGMRPMDDFDLLVTKETVPTVITSLNSIGYVEGELDDDSEIQPFTRKQQLFWQLHGSDLPKLARRSDSRYVKGFSVDINVELALPGKGLQVPVGEFLDRGLLSRIDQSPCLVLTPEDTVIDLSLHLHKNSTVLRFMAFGKHRALYKYVDLAEFLKQADSKFDWQILMHRVQELGITKPVYFALANLEALFSQSVPEDVLADIRNRVDDPEGFLQTYGQWDLPEPRQWQVPFLQRFFNPGDDAELPQSRSLI